MDLVEEELPTTGIRSTMQHVIERDFCPARQRARGHVPLNPMYEELVQANAAQQPLVVAKEMDLIEAGHAQSRFDKILLLVAHADHLPYQEGSLTDPALNQTGVSQSLDLARRTSSFLHADALEPDLVLVAPMRRAVQTAWLALPQYAPTSVKSRPWMSLPSIHSGAAHISDLIRLQSDFDGVDFTGCFGQMADKELLGDVRSTLDWLGSRDEKVIVIVSDPAWLSVMGCVAEYERSREGFLTSELRALGIHYV